jgi:hypothetical protein
MDRGPDFLKSQINNAVMQHQTFLRNLEDHEKQAEDPRYRDLCSRHIPRMREHQRMLEGLQQAVGAELGAGKKALGAVLGVGRDLADSVRESDFLRLVGDIVTARQSQDTAFTFSEAGRMLGHAQLQQVGDTLLSHHKDYVDEGNRLAVQMFVEHARGTDPTMSAGQRADVSSQSSAL